MSTKPITPRLADNLRLLGTEDTGPSVADMGEVRASQDEHELEEWVLEDLNRDIQINEQALTRKAPLFNRALRLMVLAILVKLAELVLQWTRPTVIATSNRSSHPACSKVPSSPSG